MDASVAADLSLRRLFCHFLCGSLLIVIARSEDNVGDQLQHYLNVRRVVDDIRTFIKDQINSLEGGAKDDLRRKHTSLLAFDYEAAARLKEWGSLPHIIKESETYGYRKIYGVLADITLSSEAPSETIIVTLQQIINITWKHDTNDIDKFSRWVRCLFSLALTSNIETAEQLLDQVTRIAEGAKTVSGPLKTASFTALTSLDCE
ncbi:hypothetical protein MMC28_011565 [Mycoblastus sanguinarius]|nr:hypothetical protein [Mycoblastus sanguinarius]